MSDDKTPMLLDPLTVADIEAALLLLQMRYRDAARVLLFGPTKDMGSGPYACRMCRMRFEVSEKRNAHVREAHSPRADAPRKS